MPLVKVCTKSRREITVLHPWTIEEWYEWLEDRTEGVGGGHVQLCDEKGSQYIMPASSIDFVMIPLEEENDGK